MGEFRHGRAVGAAVFVATAVLPQRALWSWVVPWTTTPETLCLLGCLLAASRFVERRRALDAFLATLAGVATAGFRPADAAIVVAVSGAVMVSALLAEWPGWQRALRVAAAAFAGAAIPVLVFGSAHLATVGLRPSEYMTESSRIGFEWRLLPLRWVMLMISPRPLFPDVRGLAAVFPWIAPGIAGMAACLATPLGVQRRLHVLVTGTVLLDCAMFLTYRDLHPTGLWRMGNFHYFKWTLPIFGLYAVLLLRTLTQRTWLPALATAACAVVGLFMWCVELTAPMTLPAVSGAETLTLPSGLSRIDDVLLAKGSGDWITLYGASSEIRAGGAAFQSFYDFKVFAAPDRIAVLPLKPMPAVPSSLHLPPGTVLDSTVFPVIARQSLVWGWPCWVKPKGPDCRAEDLLPRSPPTTRP